MFYEDGPIEYQLGSVPQNTSYKWSCMASTNPNAGKRDHCFNVDEVKQDVIDMHGRLKSVFASVGVQLDGDCEPVMVKSTPKAVKFRIVGNEKFKYGLYPKALRLYSKSIAFAVEGSEEQMLSYANRSAVLFRMNNFAPCLYDINRALQGNYPKDLKPKLLERKVQCLGRMESEEKLSKIAADATDPMFETDSDVDREWRELCNFTNPLIPNASSKIKIECSERWGRHLVAVEDIEPGEILSSQKFNSLVLHESKLKERRHCSYCLCECCATIPCPTCTKTMFCSKRCRDLALDTYHRVECKVLTLGNTLYKARVLRMFLEGTEQGTQLESLMGQMTVEDIFVEKTNPTNKPFVNDYLSVLRMSRTFNPTFTTQFLSFITSCIMTLQGIQFFGNETVSQCPQGHYKPKEIFAAMLLMNHAISARSHSVAVTSAVDLHCVCDNTVGVGICTLHSLINNSCYPNVKFFTRNREHVALALRPIKKGEQLFHAYSKAFTVLPRESRVSQMKIYFGFDCKCEACSNQWPLGYCLMPKKLMFLAKNAQKEKKGLLKELRSMISGHLKELTNQEVLRRISQICKWTHSNLREPCLLNSDTSGAIFEFMCLCYDNLALPFSTEEIRGHIEGTVHNMIKTLCK